MIYTHSRETLSLHPNFEIGEKGIYSGGCEKRMRFSSNGNEHLDTFYKGLIFLKDVSAVKP